MCIYSEKPNHDEYAKNYFIANGEVLNTNMSIEEMELRVQETLDAVSYTHLTEELNICRYENGREVEDYA